MSCFSFCTKEKSVDSLLLEPLLIVCACWLVCTTDWALTLLTTVHSILKLAGCL